MIEDPETPAVAPPGPGEPRVVDLGAVMFVLGLLVLGILLMLVMVRR